MIVLDASAVLELLLSTPAGAAVAERVSSPEESLHAPHLLSIEVTQVLRRYARAGLLDAGQADTALQDLTELDIRRWDHEPFLERVWELRDNLTAYDAVYVALAETLGAPVLTFDRRLADAPRHDATVELAGKLEPDVGRET